MSTIFAVKLCAPNDRNGNPRRGWLVYETGQPDQHPSGTLLAFVEEGYMGRDALAGAYPTARELCSLNVPYSEIRAARENAPTRAGDY